MIIENFSPALADTDGLRHMNNLAIQYWLEKARNPVFQLCNPTLSFETWNLIMVRSEVDFVHQIYFGTGCEIHTGLSRIGNSSMHISQELYQNGVLCAKSTVVTVFFDFKAQKALPFPPEIRAELQKLLV